MLILSLDPSLAFIMSNLALVKRGDFAFDPFVGTASILVSLAHLGCTTFGADIDPRVLRGMMYAGKADQTVDDTKRDIFENFVAYGLDIPDLVRLDNHILDRHCRFNNSSSSSSSTSNNKDSMMDEGMFDVIVTDPPYGIRAGAKKSGRKKEVTYVVAADKRQDHIPSTQHYPVEEVMLDLLHNAARSLVCGGRLCYLIPTVLQFSVSDLPTHPCLRFVVMCEQQLSTRHGRHAVVMEKYRYKICCRTYPWNHF